MDTQQPPERSVGEGVSEPLETKEPLDARRQCTAPSRRSGQRCRRRPILGGSVCPMHGGASGHVKAKAQERLRALEYPAIGALEALVKQRPTKAPAAVVLGAARDVLDRLGHAAPTKITHEAGPALSAALRLAIEATEASGS